MKKILTLLTIVALMVVAVFVTIPKEVEAADVYLIPITDDSSNCWITARDAPYRIIVFDTLTFHAENGDSLIDLGSYHYNFSLRSLNGEGDSGSVTVAFGSHDGFWHHDSVARGLGYLAVGLNTADDYLFAPIGSRYIYVRNVVGGTADSTTLIELKCYR